MTDIAIWVQFRSDGAVASIGALPAQTAPQIWYDFLRKHAGTSFRAIGLKRGSFLVADVQLGALHTMLAQAKACDEHRATERGLRGFFRRAIGPTQALRPSDEG